MIISIDHAAGARCAPLLRCAEVSRQSAAPGHEPPLPFTARAETMPPMAAAPADGRGCTNRYRERPRQSRPHSSDISGRLFTGFGAAACRDNAGASQIKGPQTRKGLLPGFEAPRDVVRAQVVRAHVVRAQVGRRHCSH
jgi:hypothetical protein